LIFETFIGTGTKQKIENFFEGKIKEPIVVDILALI